MLWFEKKLGVFVNVGKFSDSDKRSILRATIITKNDFEILEKIDGLKTD